MTELEFKKALLAKGLSLTDEQLKLLEQYFQLLVKKNEVMNLTSITEKGEVYEKHFYDSLLFTLNYSLDLNDKTLIDVGTGAGFPGLVLAICYPRLHVTLLEPLTKRCNFLSEVVNKLNLTNVVIVNQRSEDYAREKRETFDYAVSRAVARLPILLELVIPLIKVHGIMVALKGDKGNEELSISKKALRLLNSKVIFIDNTSLINGDKRVNIYFQKEKNNDIKYPRIYSKIKKDPLEDK